MYVNSTVTVSNSVTKTIWEDGLIKNKKNVIKFAFNVKLDFILTSNIFVKAFLKIVSLSISNLEIALNVLMVMELIQQLVNVILMLAILSILVLNMDMLIQTKNGSVNGKKIVTKCVSSVFMVIILMKTTYANFFQIIVELLNRTEIVNIVPKDILLMS